MSFHRCIALQAALVVAAATALACSPNWREDLKPVVADVETFDCDAGETPSVELRYLGSGGWFIQGPDGATLTAPFFSNPNFLEILLSVAIPLEDDRVRIEGGMCGVPKTASAILVGHSHYDHLMEVPTIARDFALPNAKIYLNETGKNLLPEDLVDRTVVVDKSAGSHEKPGEWLTSPDGSMRFMALRSEHAPHFGPIKLFWGDVEKPNPNPRNAWKWREGQTHAFLIDILRDGKPVFRIHYQDSASSPPLGFPPKLGDGKEIDVAILCMASFGNVGKKTGDYPREFLKEWKPRHVLVGHWEDFFTTGDLGPVPATSTSKFRKALDEGLPPGATTTTPEPGASLRYCVR